MTGITIDNLQTGYRGGLQLQIPHLELRTGQTTTIIGHNGCGKSTLLKAILGMQPYR